MRRTPVCRVILSRVALILAVARVCLSGEEESSRERTTTCGVSLSTVTLTSTVARVLQMSGSFIERFCFFVALAVGWKKCAGEKTMFSLH